MTISPDNKKDSILVVVCDKAQELLANQLCDKYPDDFILANNNKITSEYISKYSLIIGFLGHIIGSTNYLSLFLTNGASIVNTNIYSYNELLENLNKTRCSKRIMA